MKFEKMIDGKKIEIEARWRESCHHIYKTFKVYVNGKKSNIKVVSFTFFFIFFVFFFCSSI
jgi:hypothetical protein